jgi:hypothetical protein
VWLQQAAIVQKHQKLILIGKHTNAEIINFLNKNKLLWFLNSQMII